MRVGALGGRSLIPHGPNPSIFNVRRPAPAAAVYDGWTDFSAVPPVVKQGATTFGMTWDYALYRRSVVSAHSPLELPSYLEIRAEGTATSGTGTAGGAITADIGGLMTALGLGAFNNWLGTCAISSGFFGLIVTTSSTLNFLVPPSAQLGASVTFGNPLGIRFHAGAIVAQ